MNTKRIVWIGVIVPCVFAGCMMVPGRHGPPIRHGSVPSVPSLPRVVILDQDPYYVHSGYYYHYRGNGWYYSHSRQGPWRDLPRDRYPREVKYKDGGRGDRRGHGEEGRRLYEHPQQNPGHDERRSEHQKQNRGR